MQKNILINKETKFNETNEVLVNNLYDPKAKENLIEAGRDAMMAAYNMTNMYIRECSEYYKQSPNLNGALQLFEKAKNSMGRRRWDAFCESRISALSNKRELKVIKGNKGVTTITWALESDVSRTFSLCYFGFTIYGVKDGLPDQVLYMHNASIHACPSRWFRFKHSAVCKILQNH